MSGPLDATIGAANADRNANHTTGYSSINGSQGASQGETYSFGDLWALGYHAIHPILPPGVPISQKNEHRAKGLEKGRGKIPGRMLENGDWIGLFEWQKRTTSPREFPWWTQTGAGVGIRTGLQPDGRTILVAFDADILGPVAADQFEFLLEQRLGVAPKRIGRWPKALFLARLSAPMPNTRWDFEDELGPAQVEIRATAGQQFVCSGEHPKTGQPYVWPVALCRIEDLPLLTPDDIRAIEADWYAQFPRVQRVWSRSPSGGPGASAPYADDVKQNFFWRISRLATSSVAMMDKWVPDAFPGAIRYEGSGYRVDEQNFGRGLEEDLSISIHGICDFGTEKPYDAINVLLDFPADWAHQDLPPEAVETAPKPTLKQAAFWLADRLGVAPEGYGYDANWWKNQQERVKSDFFGDQPGGAAGGQASGGAGATARPPLRATPVSLDELLNIPPRQWLLGRKMLRGYVMFLAAPGGAGKTAWATVTTLAMASGQALLGDKPHKPMRVWSLGLEDDRREALRRLAAAMKHYGLPPAVLDNVRMDSGRDRKFCIATKRADGTLDLPDYQALIDEIKRDQIDVLVVDPFLRSHRVAENSNEDQDEVMGVYAQVAEETGCAILLIHHTKKGATGGDLDSLRGGSTQGGGARSVFTMSTMTKEEANGFGLPDGIEMRRGYVRLDDAKGNMSPATKAEWIHLENVGLGNRSDEYPDGDRVQVATRWEPPKAWDMDGDPNKAALEFLEAGLPNGERYSGRSQDDRYIGPALVGRFGLLLAEAKAVVAKWGSEKLVVVLDYESPTQRKSRKGLYLTEAGRARLLQNVVD